MKAFRLLLVLAIALVAVGLMPSAALAQQFSGYTTGINIQNLESGDAVITLTFYNYGNADGTGGSTANTVEDAITGYSVKTYFPLNQVQAGFKGSMVVSSSTKIAAVTNVSNSTMTALGAYNGSSAGSTTVYLPILHKNNSGWYSWYSIQNTGGTAANVQIAYSDNTNASVKIAPNAAVTLYQKNETHNGKLFAATLTSDQPIAVVAIQENSSNIMAYSGFSAGSKLPIMPIINMNNSGYITSTQIYNLGSTPTDVTVSYKAGAAGNDCTETQTIPENSMKVFSWIAFTNSSNPNENCGDGAKFVGSASVTGNSTQQNLAVVVNQLRNNGTMGSSYNAFDPAQAKNTVFMPTIFDRNSGWNTAFNVMNVGTNTAYVLCSYANSQITSKATLAPGVSATIGQYNLLGGTGKYVGSAVCKTYNSTFTTEDASGKILTVVNEGGSGLPDNLLSYEGIAP